MTAATTLARPSVAPDERAGLSLPRNLAWTLAGNVVYLASQWAMLVVLAKLGSPELVGQLAPDLHVTTPIFLFANLRLRAVQATVPASCCPSF